MVPYLLARLRGSGSERAHTAPRVVNANRPLGGPPLSTKGEGLVVEEEAEVGGPALIGDLAGWFMLVPGDKRFGGSETESRQPFH